MKVEKIDLTAYTALNPHLWFFQKLNEVRYLGMLQNDGSTSVVAKLHVKPEMIKEVVNRVGEQARKDSTSLRTIHGCDTCYLPAIYSKGELPDLKVSSVQGDRFITQAEHCPAILGLINLWKEKKVTVKFAVEKMSKAPCLKKRRRDVQVTLK